MKPRLRRHVRCLMLLAVVSCTGAVLPGVAWAAPGPTTTTTTTTTTTPSSATTYITFFPNGGFAIGTGTGSANTPSGPFGTQAVLRREGSRTTPAGVTVRVYAGPLRPSALSAPPGLLAAGCLPDRELLIDASDAAVAGSISIYSRAALPNPPQGTYVVQGEGSAIAVAAVRVPAGTRSAVMHFRDGSTDQAAPIGGWVVLAAAAKPPPVVQRPAPLLYEPTPTLGTLTITDRHGHTQALGAVRAALGYPVPKSCVPGPVGAATPPTTPAPITLPQPSGPPPADSAAARKAIEAAYRAIFESAANRNNNDFLQGAPVLTNAELKQLQSGYSDITGKLQVRISDFRFLNQTSAALSFDLVLDGQPVTATTLGMAVLDNGNWKVARATFCTVITRANIACG